MAGFRLGYCHFAQIGKATVRDLDAVCEATARRIVARAAASMRGTPGSRPGRPPGRVTGNLAAGFTVRRLGPARWAAVNASPHASLIERGTRERRRKNGGSTGAMARRPFLRPATRKEAKQFNQDIAGAMQKAARES